MIFLMASAIDNDHALSVICNIFCMSPKLIVEQMAYLVCRSQANIEPAREVCFFDDQILYGYASKTYTEKESSHAHVLSNCIY